MTLRSEPGHPDTTPDYSKQEIFKHFAPILLGFSPLFFSFFLFSFSCTSELFRPTPCGDRTPSTPITRNTMHMFWKGAGITLLALIRFFLHPSFLV